MYFPQTNAAVFGNNTFLRQAFEYVDAVIRLPSADDQDYCSAKASAFAVLEQDKNPFLGLNIWQALKLYREQEEIDKCSADMLTIMCELVGIEKETQREQIKTATPQATKARPTSALKS